MKPIILCGSSGRMGQAIVKLVKESDDFSLTCVARSGSAPVFADLAEVDFLGEQPVIIDFSHADLLPKHLSIAQKHGLGLVVASTGHSLKNYRAIDEAARGIPILVAPNTSIMAALMLAMGKLAACRAKTIEIMDVHHQHKKDAPSGTALALQKAFAHESGQEVNIHSIRAGEVIGDHSAYFFNDFERLELVHRVSDRRVFAQGALLAALFLFGRKPGLYSMADVLKIE